MKTRHLRADRKIFVQWLVTYLAILMIPTASFAYASSRTTEMVVRQTSLDDQAQLDAVSSSLDADLTSLGSTFSFLLSNPAFLSAQNTLPGDTAAFQRNSRALYQVLANYTASISREVGILIYFPEQNYLVSDQLAYDFSPFYTLQRSCGMTLSESEWKSMLSRQYDSVNYMISNGYRAESSEFCVVMAYSFSGSGGKCSFFITIPIQSLQGVSSRLNGRSLILTDSSGEILSLLNGPQALERLDLQLPSGSVISGANGERYICDYVQSGVNDWYYAVIASESSYWSQVTQLRTLILSASLVSLVLGLLMVSVFLKKNYRPVEQLMQMTNHSLTHLSEFEQIEHSFRDLTDKTHSMRAELNRQSEQLRNSYLLSAIKGRRVPLAGSDFNSHFDIAASGEVFLLTILTVGESRSQPDGYQDEIDYENMNLFAADNAFSELMNGIPHYRLEDGRYLIYLFHLNEQQHAWWISESNARMQKLCTVFFDQMHVALSLAVSEETNDIDQLCYLYRDSVDALEYLSTIGGSGVLYSSDYKVQTGTAFFREDCAQEFEKAITAGDLGSAQRLSARLFDEFSRNSAITYPVFRIRVMEVLYTILDAYYEIIADPEPRRQLVLKMEHIISAKNEEQLHKTFSDLLKYACDTVHSAKVGSNCLLVQQICEYVQAHEVDMNLNISTIADAFGRNPQNISRIFHAQKGIGLLEYISNVRIEHAKQLLSQKKYSEEAVAAQTGFASVRTFRRVFSRAVGRPPSAFSSDRNK